MISSPTSTISDSEKQTFSTSISSVRSTIDLTWASSETNSLRTPTSSSWTKSTWTRVKSTDRSTDFLFLSKSTRSNTRRIDLGLIALSSSIQVEVSLIDKWRSKRSMAPKRLKPRRNSFFSETTFSIQSIESIYNCSIRLVGTWLLSLGKSNLKKI